MAVRWGGAISTTGAVFFVSLLLLMAEGCSKEEAPAPEAAAPVEVATVTRETIHRIVAADGTIYPINQADVMSKVSAPVAKFYVNRGDHVKAGQLIALLENRDLVAAAQAARAQVAQAESNLRTTTSATVPQAEVKARADVQAATQELDAARTLLANRRKLYLEGALAHKLVDEAQVAYAQALATLQTTQENLRALQTVGSSQQIATAQAQLRAAEAQAKSAEAQVAYTEVRSPIDGIVADRPIYPGDMASTGQPLATIVDVSRVVARVNVPQNEVNAVHVGDPASIRFPGGALEVPGRVTVVSPATSPSATTVEVWVQATNPHDELKPGVSVHTSITAATIPHAVVVPKAALTATPEGSTVVWTVSRDEAQPRPVTIGVRQGDQVQILSGLYPGEQVITSGALGLEANAKVKVVQPSPSAIFQSTGVGE